MHTKRKEYNKQLKQTEKYKKQQHEYKKNKLTYYQKILNDNGYEFKSKYELRDTLRSWAIHVKERDGKCMKCGSTNNLEAHHIIPKSIEPLKMLDIDNGITYCINCHRVNDDAIHRELAVV